MFRFDVARAKAWGAVGMGASSRILGQRAKDNPNFFVSLASTSGGRFLPQTGAVLIKDPAGNVPVPSAPAAEPETRTRPSASPASRLPACRRAEGRRR